MRGLCGGRRVEEERDRCEKRWQSEGNEDHWSEEWLLPDEGPKEIRFHFFQTPFFPF